MPVDVPIDAGNPDIGNISITWEPNEAPAQDVGILVDGFTVETGIEGGNYARPTFHMAVYPGIDNAIVQPFFVPFIPEGVAVPTDTENPVITGFMMSRSAEPGLPPTRVHVPACTRVTFPPSLPAEKRKMTLLEIPINPTPMPLPHGLYSNSIISG
jgi:hypothetical protein